MDVFNAFKGIAGMIRQAIDETMPRQAVVTRSDATGVWVRFAPVDTATPDMWFPSTVAGLPTGTSGWVYPLAGGKGMFVASAVPLELHVFAASPAIANTTSISTLAFSGADTVTVDPGTYRADVAATIPMRRNLASGSIVACLRIGGVTSAEVSSGMTGTGIAANAWFPMGIRVQGMEVDVQPHPDTGEGIVALEFGFRGDSTAGTTSIARATMSGTLTRIG